MQALSGSVSSVLDKPSQVASTDKVEATESPSSRQETPKDIDVDIAADDYPKLDTSTSGATHTILIQNQSSGLDDPVDIMPQTLNQGLARSDNSFPEFNHDILALESLTPHTNSLSHQLPNIWSFEYQMGLQPYVNALTSSQQFSVTLGKDWTESNSPFSDHIQVLQKLLKNRLDLIRPLFQPSPQL